MGCGASSAAEEPKQQEKSPEQSTQKAAPVTSPKDEGPLGLCKKNLKEHEISEDLKTPVSPQSLLRSKDSTLTSGFSSPTETLRVNNWLRAHKLPLATRESLGIEVDRPVDSTETGEAGATSEACQIKSSSKYEDDDDPSPEFPDTIEYGPEEQKSIDQLQREIDAYLMSAPPSPYNQKSVIKKRLAMEKRVERMMKARGPKSPNESMRSGMSTNSLTTTGTDSNLSAQSMSATGGTEAQDDDSIRVNLNNRAKDKVVVNKTPVEEEGNNMIPESEIPRLDPGSE